MSTVNRVCFDRILPSELRRPIAGRMMFLGNNRTRAAFQIAKLWSRGQTLRIRFLNGTASQRDLVRQHAVEWTEYANLRFDFDNTSNAQIRIAFDANDGAWSYIGTDALGIPANQPTMNLGWQDQGVILHEFGHMLGMIHEHQTPNGNPIAWNKAAVNAALSGPPNFWDQATIDHNMYARYDVSQINGSQFDPASVMLYSFPPSWTLNGFHTPENTALSDLDKAFAQHVYPHAAAPVDLPVHEATAASIGQPGEEDLYRFVADREAAYTVETEGPTDVVMTLFGPAGERIAQDDDSGVNRNARITALLSPGAYTVQVRHYNSSNGTGSYGIKVVR